MKKIILFTLIISLIALGCSKEETKEKKENLFTFNGSEEELGQNGLFYVATGSSDYLVTYVHIYSSSIAWNEGSDTFWGVGDIIILNLYIPGTSGILQDGTYEFGTTFEGDLQLRGGQLALNIIYPSDIYDNFETRTITSGEVKIKKDASNEVYTITFKTGLDNEESLSGSFTGTLDFYSTIMK